MQEYKSIAYSDKKIKAKYTPEYSVLKPETNSDSASEKSKGARCVSAKVQITQIGKKNKKIREDCKFKERILQDIIKIINKTIKVLKTDS